jgi:hypothetical protein
MRGGRGREGGVYGGMVGLRYCKKFLREEPGGRGGEVIAEIYGCIFIGIRRKSA